MKSIQRFLQANGFVLSVFIIWRLALFLFEFLGLKLLPFKGSFPYYDTVLAGNGLPAWLWQWGNFDGVHYLILAKSGYDGFGTQVFFPFYPLLIHITGYVVNPIIGALLISNLSILLAAIILFQMTKNKWAVVFLFAFPTSFFFGAIYTEALFLLLVLLAYSKSKLFAIPAGATRLVGSFIHPLAWLGLAVYSLYLAIRFDKPLFFLSAQSAFANGRADSFSTLVNPFQVVFRYLKIFATANPSHYDFWIAGLEFAAFLFGVSILVWLTLKRKVQISWLLFSWAALILPTLSGTLSSMPRYLLTIFPIYIGLALIKNSKAKLGIVSFFVVLLGILTALFTRGYWIS